LQQITLKSTLDLLGAGRAEFAWLPGHPQPNDTLKGDQMELPLNVAVCTVERSTSKGKPDGRTVGGLHHLARQTDGYASAVGWPGYGGLEGPEYLAWLDQSPERHYTAVMGATTYRLMSDFAATSDDPSFAQLTEMSKVVFSSPEEPVGVGQHALGRPGPVEAVRSMKEAGAPPLRTIGSLTLCRSLLQAGLVDRFRVVVFPVITGSTGRERIYDEYPDVGLEMVASRTFDGRLQLLEYVPTVLTAPPSGGQLT
jgi:dihydrofolate reductase